MWVYGRELGDADILQLWKETQGRYPPSPPAPPPQALDWNEVSADHAPPTWTEQGYLQSLKLASNAEAGNTPPVMSRVPPGGRPCYSAECAKMREARLPPPLVAPTGAAASQHRWHADDDAPPPSPRR